MNTIFKILGSFLLCCLVMIFLKDGEQPAKKIEKQDIRIEALIEPSVQYMYEEEELPLSERGQHLLQVPVAQIKQPVFTDKDVRCLALNSYHEARGDGFWGMRAVTHVVMNRVHSERFPNTICEVVKQGDERHRHRCQFSWWCDGRSDKPRDKRAWAKAIHVARAILSGEYSWDPTKGALFYHARRVNPDWRDDRYFTVVVASHRFYTNDAKQHEIKNKENVKNVLLARN